MKRLWAPWRIHYITSAQPKGCFMCAIFKSRRDRANLVIQRGKTCALVMNRYPYNGGHLMVAPYRHVAKLSEMTPEERSEMMDLTLLGTQLLDKVSHAHGYNIGLNIGEAAGAGLKDHIHQHIVPRWNGDTNFMPVLADIKVMPQTLEEMRDQLCAALKS